MKFNVFYLLWPAALGTGIWLFNNFDAQNRQSFFATAETEPRSINLEHATMAQQIFVKVGQEVKKGDTLAVFFRTDLGQKEAETRAEVDQYNAELQGQLAVLTQEEKYILAQKEVELSKIRGELAALKAQESAQNLLKEVVSSTPSSNKNGIILAEIQALERQLAEIERAAIADLKRVAAQKAEVAGLNRAKKAQSDVVQGFIDNERQKLVVCAPIDGFLETVAAVPNELIPAFQVVFKINPLKPNRVIGFIHETVDVPLQLGDSVWLMSTTRDRKSVV